MGTFLLNYELTCGYTTYSDHIAYPEKYNISHCLNPRNVASVPVCQKVFGKMFKELLCLKKAKENFAFLEQDKQMLCDCPPACVSSDFETHYSLAAWPNEGPEQDAAYQELVLGKMINDLNKSGPSKYTDIRGEPSFELYTQRLSNEEKVRLLDLSSNDQDQFAMRWLQEKWPNFHFEWIINHPWIRERIMSYLTNPQNRKEILNDFTRLTVYIKDLTVETTEDVPEYPWESLLSDIGNYLLLLRPMKGCWASKFSIMLFCIYCTVS